MDEDLASVDQSVLEVDPSELFDSSNNLFDSRLSEELGRALKLSADEANKGKAYWALCEQSVLKALWVGSIWVF